MRPLKLARRRKFRHDQGRFLMRRTSRGIRENRFQLIHNKDEFSKPLRYLINTIGHHGEDFLPENSDLFEAISDAIQSGT
jgi:hypothetical protein